MKFENPILKGTLIKRYKRFLADVKLASNEIILAHVPNSGSMMGVSQSGSPCLLSVSSNPKRKIPYTLEMVQTAPNNWVGVNTSKTNHLVREAFENKLIPHWKKFNNIKAEVKINPQTRLDFLLTNKKEKLWVEVKNVSMSIPPWATFPDAKTLRGQKHLKELMSLAKKGDKAEIVFIVQRQDCKKFRPCHEIDPEYTKLLQKAFKAGVKISCWACKVGQNEITVFRRLPVILFK
ncbi:MAG: DNA/RNA nuclease SfsA [Oligoflexia bacterium]|nr:DNA/RNA nuclease SfsA [Oligoflexia bacterium]